MTNELDIRKRLKEKILSYLRDLGTSGSQVDILKQISRTEKEKTGLQIKWIDDLTDRDGQYLSDKKLILLNSNINYKPRVLFTTYHELMHYMLEDVFEDVYSTYLEALGTVSDSKYRQAIESLCNYGAGIFLVPDSVLQIANNTLLDGQEFKDFVNKHNEISVPALLCRLSYEVRPACIFIILRNGLLQNNYDGNSLIEQSIDSDRRTYIEYAFNSLTHKYPLKRFHPISKYHILNFDNILQDCIHTAEKCSFPYSQTNKVIPAWISGYRLNDRYFGILYAKEPTYNCKEQMILL